MIHYKKVFSAGLQILLVGLLQVSAIKSTREITNKVLSLKPQKLANTQETQTPAQENTVSSDLPQAPDIDTQKLDCESTGNNCDKAYCQCEINLYEDIPCYWQIIGESINYKCGEKIMANEEFLVKRNKFLSDANACIKEYEICYKNLIEKTNKDLPDDVRIHF